MPTVVAMAASGALPVSSSAQASGFASPTTAAGTGAAGLTELVTSLEGRPATRASGPELDVQPDMVKAIKAMAEMAERRMAPTYAKQGIEGSRTRRRDARTEKANGRLPAKIESNLNERDRDGAKDIFLSAQLGRIAAFLGTLDRHRGSIPDRIS